MTFVQVAVVLMLFFEIYEVLSYKSIKEFYALSKKPYSSFSGEDHETITDNSTKLLAGYIYLLLIITLLFTSAWYLSVVLLLLALLSHGLKKMNMPFIVYFIIDKVVSIIAIGYTLLQLF